VRVEFMVILHSPNYSVTILDVSFYPVPCGWYPQTIAS